jgi:hypothetical protein
MKKHLLLLTLVATSLLLACKSSETGIDACTFATRAEVEAALGEPVGEGQRGVLQMEGMGDFRGCQYVTVQKPGKVVFVAVMQQCESLTPVRTRAKEALLPVPELGEDALWATESGTLMTREKGSCLWVQILDNQETPSPSTAEQSARLEASKSLLKKALLRLPP